MRIDDFDRIATVSLQVAVSFSIVSSLCCHVIEEQLGEPTNWIEFNLGRKWEVVWEAPMSVSDSGSWADTRTSEERCAAITAARKAGLEALEREFAEFVRSAEQTKQLAAVLARKGGLSPRLVSDGTGAKRRAKRRSKRRSLILIQQHNGGSTTENAARDSAARSHAVLNVEDQE